MKKLLIVILITLFFVPTLFAEKRVAVKGYYRKDGTYVRPHYRSAPDGDKSNNYGSASYQQRQQYKSYSTLPSYNNDYDNEGVVNRYDQDDDNDGISDNYDSSQYGRQNNYYQSSTQQSSSYVPSYNYKPQYSIPSYNYRSQDSYTHLPYFYNNDDDSYDFDSEDSSDYDE